MSEGKQLKTIAIYGMFGVYNIGNEATLAATLHGIRAQLPTVQFVLISGALDPVAAIEAFPQRIEPDLLTVSSWTAGIKAPRRRDWARAASQLATEPLRRHRTRVRARDIDLLLIAGTGIADDFYQGPFDTPHNLQRWCSAVRAHGGLVRFASIGAGPVAHPWSVRWFRKALRLADFRSYREKTSKRFALDIGAGAAADPVLPDLVFSLPVTADVRAMPANWPPKVIGIGVMGYYGWNVDAEFGDRIYAEYLDKLSQVIATLLERGYSIRLIVGDRGSDPRVVSDLMQRFGADSDKRVAAGKIESYLDVMREIAQTDLVIATRFHNVLLALHLQRPVISVEYHSKNSDLMQEVGLERFCHSIETFDPGQVLHQVDELANLAEPPLRTLGERLREYRAQLDEQYKRLVRIP